MIEVMVISVTALVASALTVFSGFGLGTILLPVFALFFQAPIAVAMTAIVHFGNNLAKLVVFAKFADRTVVRRFGLPALLASFVGARALLQLADDGPLLRYVLFNRVHDVTLLGIVLGLVIAVFAMWETVPRLARVGFDPKYLPIGGALSGFFGGLSGNQGALRSAFLMRCGLSKEAFIGTGVVIACLVDAARLALYGRQMNLNGVREGWPHVVAALVCAALGVVLSRHLLNRVSMAAIRRLVTGMLLVIAALLIVGLV